MAKIFIKQPVSSDSVSNPMWISLTNKYRALREQKPHNMYVFCLNSNFFIYSKINENFVQILIMSVS